MLVRDGTALAAITIDRSAPTGADSAARVLQAYLDRISGAHLTLSPPDDAGQRRILFQTHTPAGGRGDLGEEGLILRRGDSLIFCAQSGQGLGIIVLCTSFSGCVHQAEEDTQKHSEVLIIGISEDPHGFFPWIDSYDTCTLSINLNIFNPLVAFGKSFKLFPKLAKSWNNPDDCTWRFFLRNDVKFHNGYDFTAHDVKYSIDLVKDNKSHVLRDLLTEVKEVFIIDNYTVDIKTYQPFPVLLNKLTNIPIASKRYLEESKEKWPINI